AAPFGATAEPAPFAALSASALGAEAPAPAPSPSAVVPPVTGACAPTPAPPSGPGCAIGGGSLGIVSTIDEVRCRVELHVKKSDVNMKIAAVHVVRRVSRLPAPLEPKIVWLEPPKTAPMSAPFPVCSRTTTIRKKQAITCRTVITIDMAFLSSY